MPWGPSQPRYAPPVPANSPPEKLPDRRAGLGGLPGSGGQCGVSLRLTGCRCLGPDPSPPRPSPKAERGGGSARPEHSSELGRRFPPLLPGPFGCKRQRVGCWWERSTTAPARRRFPGSERPRPSLSPSRPAPARLALRKLGLRSPRAPSPSARRGLGSADASPCPLCSIRLRSHERLGLRPGNDPAQGHAKPPR